MFKFQNDELFSYLDEYLNRQYQDLLIEDYLRLSKIKPKRWWKARLDKSEVRETMHYLIEKYDLDQEEVFRYGVVEKVTDGYLLAIYQNYQVSVKKYS